MKFLTCALLVAFVVCAVQGQDWGKKTKSLTTRFEALVNKKASQAIERVRNADKTLQKGVYKFFQMLESKINSTVSNAIKDIDIMKDEVPLECYANATKELVFAQEAALANLLACQNMSQAYVDIGRIAQLAEPIVLDIVKDVKVIIEGVAVCGTDVGFAQWKCAFQYVAEEVRDLVSQWPEAKAFVQNAERIGYDIRIQVGACLNAPSQLSLEKKIKEAMSHFSSCSQQSIDKY